MRLRQAMCPPRSQVRCPRSLHREPGIDASEPSSFSSLLYVSKIQIVSLSFLVLLPLRLKRFQTCVSSFSSENITSNCVIRRVYVISFFDANFLYSTPCCAIRQRVIITTTTIFGLVFFEFSRPLNTSFHPPLSTV